MFTDRLTEIINSEWKYKTVGELKPVFNLLRRTLAKSFIPEKRLLEKELGTLCKIRKELRINMLCDLTPVTGGIICSLNEITAESIINCVSKVSAVKYLTSTDIDTMVWQAKFCLIKTAVLSGGFDNNDCAVKLALLTNLDVAEICSALNPLDRLYSEDKLYNKLTADTRAMYRKMTAEISLATGIDEARLSREYLSRALNVTSDKETAHIGEVILSDYRRVFPLVKLHYYLMIIFSSSFLLSVLISCFTEWWIIFLVLPVSMAVIKPIADYLVTRFVRVMPVTPGMELEEGLPAGAATLCVISTILGSEKDAEAGYQKLCAAKLRNRSDNIKFALLCDLKGADEEKTENDERIIASAKKVFDGKKDFIVLIRNRRFSKTQSLWQGHERKRGAILALVGLLRRGVYNGGSGFRAVFGDSNALSNIKYLALLDYDTRPLMDSITELVGIALHPFHKDKGIIAPRITTTLKSYLRSGFSRAMSANGGCAGASTYDSFTGEMYQDCFGEGIFTGKGLVDVDIFAERCIEADDGKKERFPDERILSHDILEGGCTGVVFAGGIEFSDSFPDTSSAYYKRQHRWIRGDLQNARYIFDRKFSGLTRWKLADNVRRGITPIFITSCLFAAAVQNSACLAITALAAIIMPFLTGFIPSVFRGRRFANYRRFYSPILSQTKQLLRQCVLEIMLTPKNTLVSLDALLRTAWRLFVTKKHLLDWTTSAAFEGLGFGFKHLLGAEILSFALMLAGVLNFNVIIIMISTVFIAALPAMTYADRVKGEQTTVLSDEMKKELISNAGKMWQFYEDFVTEEYGFLPPDNVQYSPVYRVSPRTSPTNIGMYLLSAVCAKLLDFIDNDGIQLRVERSISTVERLEKWHGNLMNWYETEHLAVISPFVSSVDSGNFVCCLVALKEALKEFGCNANLISRIEKLIENTDLRPFYNKSRRLFSIGYDVSREELSRHHYDLIMSESRMLSYYAIAKGQVDKKHWRALGRVMGKDGHYAAPVAWTGTMFEYFMPELLLKSKEGSMEYEALRFSLYCQQKRGLKAGLPFGISESGYYAFDEELNYQYKAHGVQAVGLKADLNKEYVVSPYSSFLSLAYDPINSYNNLARLEKLGVTHPEYGFYEAVDFTKKRVGSGCAIIKSHMAHHMGMSVAGIVNALLDGKIQDLFHADEQMKRAEELLEEKIIAGETVLGPPEFQKEEEYRMNAREFNDFSLRQIRANPLSNGKLTVISTDIGITDTFFEHKSMMLHSGDLMHPRGSLFAFVEGEYLMPFFWHPTLSDEVLKAEQSVLFMQNSSEYYRNFRNLRLGMQLFLHSAKPIEIRKFAAENKSGIKRQMTLSAYIEPALAHTRDIEAHPAFMDLFLKVRYDEENKLFIASRKERLGNNQTVMAIGFTTEEDFTFSLNRESVISRNGGIFSSMDKAKERENITSSVPCPCIFIKADFPLDAHGKKETELFICYGRSDDEVKALAREVRASAGQSPLTPPSGITSPLVQDTIYGRLARRILPHIMYTPDINTSAVLKNKHDVRALWRFGISGDRPIVLFEFSGGKAAGADGIIEMKKALSLCQVEFDLVILFETGSQKRLAEQIRAEICTELFLIGKDSLDDSMLNFIRSVAISTVFSDRLVFETPKSEAIDFFPLLRVARPEKEGEYQNRFEGGSYIIENPPELPWCNVLASTEFGSLVSDRSLGFSWALNSRENKLTPWFNDLRSDNSGEMLVMKMGNNLYDLIDGGIVKFAPNRADYHGVVKGIHAKTSVRVFAKGMGKKITLEIENRSKKPRIISLAYYAEPIMGVNRERTRLIKPAVSDNTLIFTTNANSSLSGAMTITCGRTAAFITDRIDFWCGKWQSGEINPGHDLIGAVIVKLELPPKQKEKIEFMLSFTKNTAEPLSMQKALIERGFTASAITAGNISTGDERLDALYKYWLPWQTIGCRMWARTGFYQNSGAYGFRDQLQDAMSIAELYPELAKRQIIRACTAQFSEGDVLHWWHDLPDAKKGVRTRYSDDLVWLPFALTDYIMKTGDYTILNIEVYYAEGETLKEGEHERYSEISCGNVKESVYAHAKKALEKAYSLGNNELPLIGSGDWCDGYNTVGKEGKGESVWLAMFYGWTARRFAELTRRFKDDELYAQKLEERADALFTATDKNAWDGKYYLRAFYDNGRKMGSHENDLCTIDLLPQAFSVLAGMPCEKRSLEAVTKATELLTDYNYRLIKLFTPPFKYGKTWQTPGYVMSYPEGVRENGGQYTHAAVWLALACKEAGLHELAERLSHLLAPFGRGNEYKTEPYYMSADIYTNPEAYGRGGWSIYTGSAGWYFTLLGEVFK